MRVFCGALLLVFAACIQINAQTTGAQVSGVVQDATGASVPDAQITITNTDTGAARTATSASDGSYSFPTLATGPYKLEVSKGGFATFVQTGVILQVGSNPQVNVSLKVGTAAEQIEVQADAAMVETHSTGVGQVIDQQRVVELPLNGRNLAQLISLSGAAVNYTGGLNTNQSYPNSTSISIAGGQPNTTNFFLDGGSHLDGRTNIGLPLPFPDAVQEFKVESSSLPANYGTHAGGTVNVVTKSGTNAIHGNAFYFVRNGAMNARNFFAPTRDSLKRNQFGGVAGGPIIKNKLFIFGGYQGTIVRTAPATTVAFAPTAAVKQGDFRTILAPPCQAKQVNLNAFSGAVNNVIPTSLLNPVALKVLALVPVSTDPCGKTTYGIPFTSTEHQMLTRLDWQRSENDSWFVRYFFTDFNNPAYYQPGNLLTIQSTGSLARVQSIILGDTRILSPTTVNQVRASFARSAVQDVTAPGIPTLSSLGSNVTTPVPSYTGQFQVTGYFSIAGFPNWIYTNEPSVSEDLTLSLHNHQINVGGSWVHVQLNANGLFQINPRFTFNGNLTGNALADLLTGNLDTMLQGGGQIGRDGQNLPSAYIQDNWRVGHGLQINLGLRWDPFIPQHDKYGYAAQFDQGLFDSGKVSSVYTKAPAGLTFPGDAGYPGMSNNFPRYFDFAPRIGLVYDPRGKGTETIRAGYGVFYDTSFIWLTFHMMLNPPWGNTITLTNPVGGLSNPWQAYPGGNPFPLPAKIPADASFPQSGVFTFEPLHAKMPYTQQWNLAFQKQLAANWLVSATYLGNKTTHQWLGYQANPSVYIPGNCVAGQYGLTAAGPCSTTSNTEARRALRLRNPAIGQYYGSMLVSGDNSNAIYNAMLLALQHRFSQHFSLSSNYTWSHCLNQGEVGQDIVTSYRNPNDRRSEWGNCALDHRQIFNTSLVASSPGFGSSIVKRIVRNWQLSGIFTASTGAWLSPVSGTDVSLTAVNLDRPNVVGDWRTSTPTLNQWFNTAAFAKNVPGNAGNAGRSIVLGPGAWNLDAALFRDFAILERLKLDFRAEAFNLLNHARFNNPGVTLSQGTTFGVITTAQDPRIFQMAMKLTF
jgi:hypothetical protein